MKDDDLVYDGRARKRPPGANSTVVLLFDLLDTRPEGVTVEDAIGALRAGFPTDGYRAYEATLKRKRIVRGRAEGGSALPGKPPPPMRQYGTTEFKRAAERWWIQKALRQMIRDGTAARDGDLWFRGERSPLHRIVCDAGKAHLVPYDSKKGRAENAAQVRRAHIREDARKALAGKSLKAKDEAIRQLMEIS